MIKIMELEVKLPKHAKEVTVDRTIMALLHLKLAKEPFAIRIMEQEVKLPNHVKVVTVDRTMEAQLFLVGFPSVFLISMQQPVDHLKILVDGLLDHFRIWVEGFSEHH